MNPGFHDCLTRGIDLFNQQEFFEAHEAWEQGWLDELGDERLLLQGLIQVAAGFYKLQVGAPTGTVKLLENGLRKLRPFVGKSEGVDLERLIPEVERWKQQAQQLIADGRCDYDPSALPTLRYERQPTLH